LTKPALKNLPASVRQKLANLARERNVDFGLILVKYGLAGPATLYLDVAPSDDMIANGLARWYQVVVVPGTESRTVVELYGHPEDIEYVQLIPVPGGRAVGG